VLPVPVPVPVGLAAVDVPLGTAVPLGPDGSVEVGAPLAGELPDGGALPDVGAPVGVDVPPGVPVPVEAGGLPETAVPLAVGMPAEVEAGADLGVAGPAGGVVAATGVGAAAGWYPREGFLAASPPAPSGVRDGVLAAGWPG
jgi:hypothetical protein